MAYAVRISLFLLFSISAHWLVLQIEFTSPAVLQANRYDDVGFVVRAVEQFMPVQAAPQTVEKTPQDESVGALQQVMNERHRGSFPQKKRESLRKPVPAEEVISEVTPSGLQKPLFQTEMQIEPQPFVAPEKSQSVLVEEQTGSILPASVVPGQLEATMTQSQAGLSAPVQTLAPTREGFKAALPRYELNPPPEYPETAWRRGEQGTVQLEVLVQADGRVGELKVVSSSGYKSLDRAALKAVRYWQFKPATALGSEVESRVHIPVDFVLEKS